MKLQEILGFDITMEKILACKPNTKEYNNIKKLKETRERSETLTLENSDMERRMKAMQEDVEFTRLEMNHLKQKHAQQVSAYNKKLDELKEMYEICF